MAVVWVCDFSLKAERVRYSVFVCMKCGVSQTMPMSTTQLKCPSNSHNGRAVPFMTKIVEIELEAD